jgi:hypothetical protein
MPTIDIIHRRLHNQRIAHPPLDPPAAAVAWLGAVQAQDDASARWAVGLRCRDTTNGDIEQAIAGGTVVRTWLLRGTLHLVAGADVRWMLSLLAPRLIANSARRHRQLDLDDATISRGRETLVEALEGGNQLARREAMQVLETAGISTEGQRGYHMLRHIGLEGLICFGPMRDRQDTFVLLDEWVSAGERLKRDQALAELAWRYFRGHGPATLQDFVWWSGQRVSDARAGLEMAQSKLRQETIGSESYWFPESDSIAEAPSPTVHLLPSFDEYFLGYRDRTAVLDPKYDSRVVSSNGVFRPMIVIDGHVVGIWKQSKRKDKVTVTPEPFEVLTVAEKQALAGAAQRYGAFLGQPVVLA